MLLWLVRPMARRDTWYVSHAIAHAVFSTEHLLANPFPNKFHMKNRQKKTICDIELLDGNIRDMKEWQFTDNSVLY